MSGFENIRSLSSFRKVEDKIIERKKVGRILEGGRNTPSPGNVQTLEFVAIEDDDTLDNLSQILGDGRVAEAPLTIVVISDEDRMRRKIGNGARDFCFAEASTAVQNMRLVAEEEGVSSIWNSGFDDHAVADQLKIPEGKIPVAAASFAYTGNPVRNDPPFGMNEVVYYDSYGRQIGSFFDGAEWKGLKEERRIYGKKADGVLTKLKHKLEKVL